MLRFGRFLLAVPTVIACAGLAQTACATPRLTVTIRVGHARRTLMPHQAVAIGEILPGAEPFVGATAGGTLTAYATGAGQRVNRGGAVATIRPRHGALVVVRAPVTAIVTRTLIPVGGHVTAGTGLVALRGRNVRQALLPFATPVAARCAVGQPVYLHSPLKPRGRLLAHITAIKPDTKTGVSDIYTDLPPLPGFAPGSPVRADIVLAEKPAITVPSDSIALRPIGSVVFVIRGGRVHEHVVRVQIRGQRRVAVSGLAAGARVAAGALSELHNGMRVRIRSPG